MRIRELYKLEDRIGATPREESKEKFEDIKIQLDNSIDYSIGACVEDGELAPFADFFDLPLEVPVFNNVRLVPTRVYNVDGEIFLYATNGYLYKQENGVFKLFCDWYFASEPQILNTIYEGEKYTIVLSNGKKLMHGENGEEIDVYMNTMKHVALCNGMLFFGEGDILSFGNPFDYETNSVDYSARECMKISRTLGDIQGLVANGYNLLIVCKHGVANLNVFGEESQYILTEYSLPYIDIEEDSVINIGNKVCFISENKFCTLLEKNLKTNDMFLGEKLIKNGKASSCKSHYILPVKIRGREDDYLYVRNVQDGKEWIIPAKVALSKREGYAVSKNGKICMLDFSGDSFSAMEYKTEKIFFESQKGVLSEISIEAEGDILVEVCGDFGVRNFYATEGINKLSINKKTKFFTIKINSDSGKIGFKNLCVRVQ